MPIAEWTPELQEVGALIWARTKDRRANRTIGTFNDDTVVTAQTANQMIALSMQELSLNIPSDIPDADSRGGDVARLRRGARAVAALLTALTIEGSLTMEQSDRSASYYRALKERYDRLFPKLLDAIIEAGGDPSGEDGDGRAGYNAKPSYDFGDHCVTDMREIF